MVHNCAMLNRYPGAKLRNLRRRAMLTQVEVVNLTGIAESTLYYLERGSRRAQSATLKTLLTLYSVHISRLEHMERLWGEDGLEKGESGGGPVPPARVAQGDGNRPGDHTAGPAADASRGCLQDNARPGNPPPWRMAAKENR